MSGGWPCPWPLGTVARPDSALSPCTFLSLSLSLSGGPLQWDVRDGAGRWACSVLLLVQRSSGGELRLFFLFLLEKNQKEKGMGCSGKQKQAGIDRRGDAVCKGKTEANNS